MILALAVGGAFLLFAQQIGAPEGQTFLPTPTASRLAPSPSAVPSVTTSVTAQALATATRTPTVAPALVATPVPATTGPALPTATTLPSPTPIPVSEAEANAVVYDFFLALDQDDYQRAIGKGHGRGQEQIRQMVSAIEGSAAERGVQPDLAISNLSTNATTQSGPGRLVSSSFNAVAYARAGPLSVPVTSATGYAVFQVERVSGVPMITEITSIEGLPGI